MHIVAGSGILSAMPLPVRMTTLRRGDREILEQYVRARTTPRRVLERARIVLASADGLAGDAICALLDVSRPTVSRWLDRYDAEGAAGLLADRPRTGRPKQITPAMEAGLANHVWEIEELVALID